MAPTDFLSIFFNKDCSSVSHVLNHSHDWLIALVNTPKQWLATKSSLPISTKQWQSKETPKSRTKTTTTISSFLGS
jgi:hypothetical protein